MQVSEGDKRAALIVTMTYNIQIKLANSTVTFVDLQVLEASQS